MKTFSSNWLLVTGCAGFIGSEFCRQNLKNYNIIGIDKMTPAAHPDNVPVGVEMIRADISDESMMTRILQRFPQIRGIVNFAAESHVDASLHDDSPFWQSNVLGVRVLAKLALSHQIRMVQVSTDEVYGSTEDEQFFLETSELRPRNPYAASKASAELLLHSYFHSYGLDVVITRGSNTIGPRQSPDKAVPKAIDSFLSGRSFPLFRTPARRLWMDVADHAEGVRIVLEQGRAGECYNIAPSADNECLTSELIMRVQRLLGRGEMTLVEDRAGYDLRYLISAKKMQQEFGWQAQIRLDDSISKTVAWYQAHTSWLRSHALGSRT